MAKDLEAALKSLDPKDDAQWTGDGLPRMDVLQELTGNVELTRREVSAAAPNFTRDNPQMEKGDAPAPNGATDQGATTPGPDEAAKAEEAKAEDNQNVDGAKTEADTQAEAAPPTPPAIENDGTGAQESDTPADNIDAEGQPTSASEEVRAPAPAPEDVNLEAEDEELAALDDDLASLDEKMERANERMAELLKEKAELQAASDRIIEAREKRKDPDDDLKARLAFIQSQHAVRAERAGAAQVARELREAVLGPRSQLDRAMGERPGRFTGRPPVQPRRNQGDA